MKWVVVVALCATFFACGDKNANGPPARGVGGAPAQAFEPGEPDLACASDADCATTTLVLAGATSCCEGCSYKIASKRWIERTETACAAVRPTRCVSGPNAVHLCNPRPPIPRCEAGECTGTWPAAEQVPAPPP